MDHNRSHQLLWLALLARAYGAWGTNVTSACVTLPRVVLVTASAALVIFGGFEKVTLPASDHLASGCVGRKRGIFGNAVLRFRRNAIRIPGACDGETQSWKQ